MKRFLLIFIFTSLLFGQDILTLKNGESFEGAFYGKVGENIVFKVEGETSTKNFSINDVNTITTKEGELTYPFDVPKIADDFQTTYERHETLNYSVTNTDILIAGAGLCCLLPALFILVMMSCEFSGSGCGQ